MNKRVKLDNAEYTNMGIPLAYHTPIACIKPISKMLSLIFLIPFS